MPTPPTCPPLEYFEEIATTLAKCAPSYLGAEFLSDSMSAPRYTWVPAGDSWATDAPRDPDVMGAFTVAFVVHVYGKTYVHAWRLRGALLTALRDAALGTYVIGNAEWPIRDKGSKGVVCWQTISIRIPILAQAYPEDLGDEITDVEPVLGQATTIGGISTSID